MRIITISLFIIIFGNRGTFSALVNNYVCTEEFCNNYLVTSECPVLNDACKAQNSTYNGIVFPSATPCSCCEQCLENLNLGDYCSIGSPGLPVPTTICGPGLTCRLLNGDDHTTCQYMIESKCLQEQKQFDADVAAGIIGHLMQRPSCDENGDYNPFKCIPGQICYCLDKEGNRIFGESFHTQEIEFLMRCECSRLEASLTSLFDAKYPNSFARCDEKGSFDILQCIDDNCLCVNVHTGSPTSNIYNLTLGLSSMDCFNKSSHHNTTYYRECDNIKMNLLKEVYEYENEGYNILDFDIKTCQPDGWYSRVQHNNENIYCADKYGAVIEDFVVPINSAEASSMNCNCARARLLLKQNHFLEIPECCPNGNYQKVMCRRGECYCIDENGNQISIEVPQNNISSLSCYNSGNFC